MLTAITVWWLLIQRLKDKPWLKQGVVPTSQETVTSSAPKVGLWVFLAVVSSLFGLFASAYTMRMARPRRARVVATARRAERAVDQHARSSCSRAARCRSRATASTPTISRAGASYFLAAGVLTVVFLAGQVFAWQQARAGGNIGPGQPRIQLLRAADGYARPALDRRALGARPHDGAHFPRRRCEQRRRTQPDFV